MGFGERLLEYTGMAYDSGNFTDNTDYYMPDLNGALEKIAPDDLVAKKNAVFSGYKKLDAATIVRNSFERSFVTHGLIDRDKLMEFFSMWGDRSPYIDTQALLEQNAANIVAYGQRDSWHESYILSKDIRVLSIAIGDMNEDGADDFAVAVEFITDGFHGRRSCFVVLNDGQGGYKTGQRNDTLIHHIYAQGDGFSSLSIRNGQLSIHNNGSEWWGSETFAYFGGDLRLVRSYDHSYDRFSMNGMETTIDYLAGVIESRSTSAIYDDVNGLLLGSTAFTPIVSFFENPILFGDTHCFATPYAPSLWDYEYQGYYNIEKKDLPLKLDYSPDDALALIVEKFYSNANLIKNQIPWTEETRNNYTTLLFYEMPAYYYENAEIRIQYSRIWVHAGEGGFYGAEHIIDVINLSGNYNNDMLFGNSGMFSVDAITGGIR
jgi:hypothetical protein